MMDKRVVGDLGEGEFACWCSQVGLTANRSLIDKTGWDYLVEFPANEKYSKPEEATWDRITPSLECRIQIKSNDIYGTNGVTHYQVFTLHREFLGQEYYFQQ